MKTLIAVAVLLIAAGLNHPAKSADPVPECPPFCNNPADCMITGPTGLPINMCKSGN